ncbi:MAG: cupin domain-containing protein, partial [Chloroflexota bacterium]
PWHEGSCFVPPSRWFHQHFNVSDHFDRYLAIHPPAQFRFLGEKVFNLQADQIEYVNEEPSVRQRFEAELGKRGRKSLMPDGAYQDINYVWQVRT